MIKLKSDRKCDAEQLRSFYADQIARDKAPQHMRFVSGFSMTVTGKVQNVAMRERTIKEFDINHKQGSA